jgi:hypothetical protein
LTAENQQRMTEHTRKPGMQGGQAIRALSGLLVACALTALSLQAQDIHSVASGSVQSVRAGVSQNVHAGAIARGPGGERSGAGGFAVSEGNSRVVSGRVAGYGARLGAGGLSEYASQSTASFGSANDFPSTDFVATMPKPGPSAYAALASTPSGFGVTLSTEPGVGASTLGRSRVVSHRTVHHAMKDPDAILNPFTHTIGPAIGSSIPGSSSLKETVLGATKIQ